MEIFDGTGVKDPQVGKLWIQIACVIQAKGPTSGAKQKVYLQSFVLEGHIAMFNRSLQSPPKESIHICRAKYSKLRGPDRK